MPEAPETTELIDRRAVERVQVAIGALGDAPLQVSSWGIAVEAPIAITLNGAPWTVMLATPSDVEDLAIGLAVTERVITDARAVTQVAAVEFLRDISVDLVVPADQLDQSAIRSRALIGNTACGMCGLESLAQLHELADSRTTAQKLNGDAHRRAANISDAAILSAFSSLPTRQPLNRETHSAHAAAWCEPSGAIVLVREDVGRHNALDKLIGALARREMLTDPGFVVMSSRCSYELVFKAAAANCMLLATISAPTSMALEWSRALQLPVVCRIGGPSDGRVVRFVDEAAGAS
jgi:FdhD protein